MVASADFDPRAAQYSLNLHTTPSGVLVPGGDWLLTAQFSRNGGGQDLVLHGADGASAIVPGYFTSEHPAPLITDSGARLDGSLVNVLAGPGAPLQFADLQLAQASDATGAIGEVVDVQGTVHVSRADGSQADLGQGDAVFLKDVVEAAADGKILIRFVDGTQFALSDGARMTLDDLVFNPGGSENVFSASVLQGTFVFLTGQIAPSGNMDVTTPVGTIGVRGTKVVCKLAVEGQESIVTLLTDPNGHVGRVEITNAGGTRLLDQANQATRVLSFFIAPSEPVILSQPELLNLFDDVINLINQQNRNPDNGNDNNGDTGSNQKPDGGNGTPTQAEIEAATNLQTGAGAEKVALPTTFVLMGPDATVPEMFVIPTFLTIPTSGAIEQSASSTGDNGSTADTGVEHTNDLQQPSTPPPPPPEPFTVISGGTGNDTLGGGTTRLQVFGNGGDDALSGGDLDDILDGGDGNDTLDAGPGDDVVQGGAGNDLIIGGSGAGNDSLDGGADIDTVKYQSATRDIDVNLATGKASGDPLIGIDTLANIENVIGGSGNDTITGNGAANVLDGGPGNDTIAGMAGGDTLVGGAGDDTLAGGAGNDLLQGGDGGFDVAVFSGNRSDYSITATGGQFIVADERPGGDGADTLADIESVKFADQQVGAGQLLNQPPSDIQLSNFSVAENAAGAAIGNVTVIDPDDDIHALTVSDSRFQIVDGVLRLAPGQSLDFETEPSVTFDITAKDPGGLTLTQGVTITVTDANEPPSAPADSNDAFNQVAENAANGTVIGVTALSTDPDAGEAVTYSLTDDAGGRFAIDAKTGIVTVANGSLIDFETATSHQITVQASSSGGLSATQAFTIAVTDSSPPPSVPVDGNDAPNQVAENAASGTVVGLQASSVDTDSGNPVTYSLTDDAGGRFAIDANTGIVTVSDGAPLDFETAASHQITVQATTAGGASASQTFTIDVTDVNEPPSAPIDSDLTSNQVVEQAETGTVVGITASSIDPDLGDTVTYSLSDNAGGRFAIDSGTGVVTVADGSLLNADVTPSHTVTVKATSSGGLSATETFTINVTDVNRPPSAPTDSNDAANQVAENASTGTLVGITASSSDPDAGDTVVYSLADDDGGRFAIDAKTGVVTVADGAQLDFETGASRTITVEASSSGGLSATETFFISVTDVNEAPGTPADANAAPDQVAENAVNGTAVGLAAHAVDPDSGDAVVYSLTDDAGGRFAIDSNTGVVTVANGALLDFETAKSHDITVQASSDGALVSTQTFTISVNDVNEAPSIPTDGNDAPNLVAENAGKGTVVGITASSIDPDAGDTVTYSLTDSDGGRFAIDAKTGVVTVADGSLLDFETGASRTITVEASSSAGLSATETFFISVTDVNEAPSLPTDADDSANQVAENAAAGTVVGVTAHAVDPDFGDQVTYSLASDGGGLFTIDANTGVVTVADGAVLDFESAQSHQISVKATSSGGLSTIDNFVIAVTDVNEAPAITSNGGAATASVSVPENTTAVTTVVASDPDKGDAITYSIAGGSDGNLFAIDSGTGQLAFKTPQDFENPDLNGGEFDRAFEVLVRATDGGGKFDEQLITVTLTDVDEPPSAVADANDSSNTVEENAEAGTPVGITARAVDPDAGDTIIYSLTDDAGGLFTIDANTGVVTVANGAVLDFESATSHDVTVKASSGGLFTEQTFTINVTNANELGPVVDNDPAPNTVTADAEVGTAVGITGRAIDPDAGDSVTYSLTSNPGGVFAINATTGVVTVAGELTAGSHEIEITATDNHGLATAQSFSIDVTSVENQPPSIPTDSDDAPNQVAENATNGTLVGITASSIDPDVGDAVTYSLTDNDGGRFAIDAKTGVVTVADGAHLDFETGASRTITVEASSSGGLSATETFFISVTDVNEAPTAAIDVDDSPNSVGENAEAGTLVGITARATDPDAGDTVIYSLTDSASGRFAIDADTGVVTVADGALLDFEAATSHDITVKATSSGGLSSTQTFTINIADVNEPPSTPVDTDAGANQVAENAANGTKVGITAFSTDPDAGDLVTYSLSDDAGGLFAIGPSSGIVTVANGALLTDGSYEITVDATDKNGRSASQSFTINVSDGNDAPVLVAGHLIAARGSPDVVHETELKATDDTATPSQIVYTLAALPIIGSLMLNNVALGVGATFTQQDIADGLLKYMSNGTLGDDSFVVDVSDGTNVLSGQTITVTRFDTGAIVDGDVGTPNVSDPLIVGDTAYGRLNIIGGGDVSAGAAILGNTASGNGTVWVNGEGSTLKADDGSIEVGKGGSGLLLLTEGGLVTANQLVIGSKAGGFGNASVLIGSELRTEGTGNGITVGEAGSGNLQVYLGGKATGLQLIVGDQAGSFGQASVKDPGSEIVLSNDDGLFAAPDQEDAGRAIVGNQGTGILAVSDGGHLEIRSGETANTGTTDPLLLIGRYSGSTGSVTVSGTGSSVELRMSAAADPGDTHDLLNGPGIAVGLMGDGAMIVEEGASVSLDGDEAFISVGVGNYLDPEDTTVYPGGILLVQAGGKVTVADSAGGDGGLIIGDFRSGTGTVEIFGDGSAVSIDSQGGVSVGREGYGVLNIVGGANLEVQSDSFNNLVVGEQSGSTGVVFVAGSSIVTTGTDNTVQVGYEGTGTLSVTEGGVVSTLQFEVGRYGSGYASITGDGSKIVASNDGGLFSAPYAYEAGFVSVGGADGGAGLLTIADGGVLEVRPGELANNETTGAGMNAGQNSGSTGTISVSGAGSAIIVQGPDNGINIGRGGTGYLSVTDQAQITTQFIQFGRSYGSFGTGIVSGAGSKIDASGVDSGIGVGREGTGFLTIENGGYATSDFLNIGRETKGVGQVIVTGAGSELVLSGIYGGINVARNGTGTLLVYNGGTVRADSVELAHYGGSGTVVVSGAGSTLVTEGKYGSITVGRNGEGLFTIENGGHVDARYFDVGHVGGGTGTVLVTGAGSQLTTMGENNQISVGRDGVGMMAVYDGALVKTLNLQVGRYGDGTVIIDGKGTQVIVSNDDGLNSEPYAYEAGFVRVTRGDDAVGNLNVTGGAHLDIRSGIGNNEDTFNAGLAIGYDAASSGHVLVSGAGSRIEITQEIVPADPYAGRGPFFDINGQGTLTVESQGQVAVIGPYASMSVGDRAGSDVQVEVTSGGTIVIDAKDKSSWMGIASNVDTAGSVFVTGTGSAISMSGESATLAVGRYGAGSLKISAGGSATTEFVDVGRYGGSTGSILVTGAGSKLVTTGIDNSIDLGQGNDDNHMPGGTGSLTVEDGGLVKTLNLAVGRNGSGTVSIDGTGSAIIVSNDEGRDSGDYDYESGFVRVSRNDGSYGSLKITNGAHLEIRSGIGINEDTYGAGLAIGRSALSSGHVLVSGAGSLISVTQEVVPPGPRVGYGPYVRVMGQGSLTVEQRGQVVIEGPYAHMGIGARDGADGHLEVTTGGSVLIDNKGYAGGLSIGAAANTTGSVHVSGSDSSIVLAGTGNRLTVGGGGDGSLLIDNGGVVKTLAVDLGSYGGSGIKVDGPGSSLIVSNDEGLSLAPNAAGNISLYSGATLEVVNGGRIEVRPGTLLPTAERATIDLNGGSGTGMVRVAGAGSTLLITQTAVSAYNFAGPALSLSAGMAIARVEQAGKLTIEGPGAHIDVAAQGGSEGHLEVLTGGTVLVDGKGHEAAVFVGGFEDDSPGSVVIDGPGSSLVVTGGTQAIVHVGFSTEGQLAVTHGGTLTSGISGDSVGSEINFGKIDVQIFSHGFLDGGGGKIVGDVYMDAGSSLLASDHEVAELDIQGNLLINDATVNVDVKGNGQSDFYNISGQTDILSGQFNFNFLGSYIPQAGDGFTFLRSAAINVDLNNVQYILHGISVANTFGFNLVSDGNFLTLHTLANATASDGLIYHGSAGEDVFSATKGHDELYGQAGNDTLSAGLGDDFIVGGSGEDKLDGGAGSDKFYYQTPSDGTHTAENILASKVGTGDVISNFDAKVDGGDKLVFNADAFHIAGVSTLNFIASDAEYDGTAESLTKGVSADYREGNASFIMDGANHLIYDDNGAAAGYTVVATVEVAPGSPAVTHDNLQAA